MPAAIPTDCRWRKVQWPSKTQAFKRSLTACPVFLFSGTRLQRLEFSFQKPNLVSSAPKAMPSSIPPRVLCSVATR
jgi:hypothetical protein